MRVFSQVLGFLPLNHKLIQAAVQKGGDQGSVCGFPRWYLSLVAPFPQLLSLRLVLKGCKAYTFLSPLTLFASLVAAYFLSCYSTIQSHALGRMDS